MDQARADDEDGDGLYTLGLAVCIGIAVVGSYHSSNAAEPGEIRMNKFLAHLADGPQMERNWMRLKNLVESAKHRGLGALRVRVSIVDPESLREDDSGFVWSDAAIRQTKATNDIYVRRVAQLTRSSLGPATLMQIKSHHVNNAKDMEITAEKEIKILES